MASIPDNGLIHLRSPYSVPETIKRLESVLKIFSFASGALTLLVAAVWLYEKLYR